MTEKNDLRKKYWSYALWWAAIIYSTLALVRPICDFLKTIFPFAFLVNVFMMGLLFCLMMVVYLSCSSRSVFSYFLLILVSLSYLWGINVIPYPEEKIHFIEYGVLACLCFKALSLEEKPVLSYGGAFFLTTLIGWVDELIQEVLPNRYYDLRDVGLNSMSGFLALVLIYIMERE